MRISLKHAMLTGASIAFLAFSGSALTTSPAQAGPLAVTPKNAVAPGALTETVQYRRGVRGARVGVHRGGYRTVRRGYWGGGRYVYRRGYNDAFFPAAALGLFAGALGAAAYGAPYYDDAYYSWNYGYGYYPSYYGGYYPDYYDSGYYPAYWGGYYPVYRNRVVRYRTVHRPRVVRYRAVAPRRHFIGSRTYVRSGYTVRRGRR